MEFSILEDGVAGKVDASLKDGGIWLSLFDEFSRMDPCACFGS